jgi:glucose/arabinose dehydrogenase
MAGDPTDPNRLYVVERAGLVVLIEDGRKIEPPVLDLRHMVTHDSLEQGLLGLALHPEFETNGRAFVFLTGREADTVLAEYRLDPATGQASDEAPRILLSIPDPNPFHNGGQLAFGPDGYLYVGIGDGGLLEGGWRDGRDPASLLGKILRIDVDHPSSEGAAYAIPPDNPYVDDPSSQPEIWARGLRNPWRFSFDQPTSTLWIADVGQLKWEELNVVPRDASGLNFGWNMYEGRQCFERQECDPSGVTMPAIVYSHREGDCAIVGGFVYRGPEGRLWGQYLAGDYCSGRIWTVAAGQDSLELQVDTNLLITSFGQAVDGTAYVLAQGGQLLQVLEVQPR